MYVTLLIRKIRKAKIQATEATDSRRIFDVISTTWALVLLIIIIIICSLNAHEGNNEVIAGHTYLGSLKPPLKACARQSKLLRARGVR